MRSWAGMEGGRRKKKILAILGVHSEKGEEKSGRTRMGVTRVIGRDITPPQPVYVQPLVDMQIDLQYFMQRKTISNFLWLLLNTWMRVAKRNLRSQSRNNYLTSGIICPCLNHTPSLSEAAVTVNKTLFPDMTSTAHCHCQLIVFSIAKSKSFSFLTRVNPGCRSKK